MSDNRRDQLIEFVEREFIGPDPIDWPGMTQSNGQEILASDPPRTRYIAGILYPAETTDDKADLKDDECELLDEADGEDVEVKPQKLGDGTVEFLEDAEELINRSNAYRQSAISITVSVKDGDAIRVAVSAGTYIKVPAMDPATGERLENKYKYPRTALAWENDNVPLILPTPTDGLKKFPIGTTGLQFDITYRYRTGDSRIYTFTLENAKPKVKENVSDEECFFQCKFKLFSEKGFSPLSDSQRITQDEDYQSNQLLYRNVRNYAIGHGCAADWDDSESVLWITTAIFPKYDIKPIVPSAIKGVSLDKYGMYGVLIYTASGDSEGSLGGLVRQGTKDHIEDTIRDAVRNAAWCSSDPVCIQSYGQGPESCNLAACHNCALLPETCCECGNRLLDRGTVVGTLDNKSIGFFAELLEQ